MSSYTPEQIRDNRQRFLAALRSASYKQGHGRLRTNDDRFCCLGVACDVLDPDRWTQHKGSWFWDGSRYCLPARAHAGYGLEDAPNALDPLMDDDGMTAAVVNDDLNMPFPEIADGFEKLFAKHPVEDNGAAA